MHTLFLCTQGLRRQEGQAAKEADAAIAAYAVRRDQIMAERKAALSEAAAAKDVIRQRNIEKLQDEFLKVCPLPLRSHTCMRAHSGI